MVRVVPWKGRVPHQLGAKKNSTGGYRAGEKIKVGGTACITKKVAGGLSGRIPLGFFFRV